MNESIIELFLQSIWFWVSIIEFAIIIFLIEKRVKRKTESPPKDLEVEKEEKAFLHSEDSFGNTEEGVQKEIKRNWDKQKEVNPKFEHHPIKKSTPKKEIKMKKNCFLYTDDGLGKMEEGLEL